MTSKDDSFLVYHDFFHKINSGTTVLTPNRRLSATLNKLYQQYQIKRQQTYWQTPDILPLFSWTERLFCTLTQQTWDHFPLLLNTVQEQFLWEKIISHEKNTAALLHPSKTAQIFQSAWELIQQWQINIQDPLFETTEDYQSLRTIILHLKTLYQEKQWIDQASIPSFLAKNITNGNLSPPLCIALVGFTEISPQLKNLLSSCEEKGSKIIYPSL